MADYKVMIGGQEVSVTKENIEDIITTATESGIYHWICSSTLEPANDTSVKKKPVSEGGKLTLVFWELDDNGLEQKESITVDDLLNGIELWWKNGYDHYHAISATGIDCAQIDAEGADGIFQCAIFDDIVYG